VPKGAAAEDSPPARRSPRRRTDRSSPRTGFRTEGTASGTLRSTVLF